MARLAMVAAALAVAAGGCSTRALLLVEPCPDGDTAPLSSCAGDGGIVTTLTRGLVGHWRFDDGAGSTVARDSSGYGNDGTLVTPLDPSTAWVPGHVGSYALETNGVGYASVSTRSASMSSIVHRVTLAGWLWLNGPIMDYATVASRQLGNTLQQYYHIALNSQSRPSLFISTVMQQVQPLAPTASPIPMQRWTHLAGTYDGATARLYVDGVLVDFRPVTGDFASDTTPFILGGNGNENTISERFPGRIDEVVLYNRALDESEIAKLADGVPF